MELATSPNKKSYSEFKYASGVLKRIIDSWETVAQEADRIRKLRYARDVSSQDLREAGIIKPDEIYIPVRTIDTNIRREQPQYISYLTQSPRSLVFNSPDSSVPHDIIAKGETDFTKKARYLGWEKPLIRCVDGAQTHGWDAIEVIFDDRFPGHFAIEHVGHENLIFAKEAEDIQHCEVVARKIHLSTWQLKDYIQNYGFNEGPVNDVIESNPKGSNEAEDAVHCVYKCFYKEEGKIYVGWYHTKAKDWLKTPVELFLGRRDVTQPPSIVGHTELGEPIMDFPQMTEHTYPFFLLVYVESEDPKICNLKGRGDQDEATQEGASAIQSGIVNGVLRASNIYASPMTSPVNAAPNAAPKQTDVVLANGAIYDQPLNFFHTPWPDSSAIQAFQAIVSQNQQEQSQVNFAVLNRKDSNKTATEVEKASQTAQELSSVQIILLSIFIRSVYALCWQIYQNRVLQEKIPIDPTLSVFFVNPQTGLPQDYIMRSSGDVDVIERDRKLQKMMQAWPVMANTPIANIFLEDIIRLSFPDEAERYIMAMQEAQMMAQQQLMLAANGQASLPPNGGVPPPPSPMPGM